MKNFVKQTAIAASAASALMFSASSFAAFPSNMFIDVGDTKWGDTCISCIPDADSATGVFTEFGFSQFLATSVYAFDDGSIFGDFFDSNRTGALLTGINDMPFIPASGTALDGSTPVSLLPPMDSGQVDIDALSPLVPPFGNDNEGFLLSWELIAEYALVGTLAPSGPSYTGGQIEIYFRETALGDALSGPDGIDTFLALTLDVKGSSITGPNLLLDLEVSQAATGFLWVEDSTGTFIDASTLVGTPLQMASQLDTNVNPAIPTANQLLAVPGPAGTLLGPQFDDAVYVARQTTLDGSIAFMVPVPEPGTLLLFGAGLLGLGRSVRRK